MLDHLGPVVVRVVALRAERAGLLGYDDHASYVVEDETAGSVAASWSPSRPCTTRMPVPARETAQTAAAPASSSGKPSHSGCSTGEVAGAEREVDGEVLAGTRDALYLVVRGETTRIPWEQVEAAHWDRDTDVVRDLPDHHIEWHRVARFLGIEVPEGEDFDPVAAGLVTRQDPPR